MDSGPPSKQYLKIGEVSRLASLNPSVLRFWETEFAMLRPQKSRTGQRLYSKDDVELVFKIKKLLYEEKLTIAGARKVISRLSNRDAGPEDAESLNNRRLKMLEEVRRDLENLRNSL